jgi:NADH-quinone oxidoreductase subunit C
MALETTEIQQKLIENFGSKVLQFSQERDIFTFEADSEIITAVILFLKNDTALRFHFLTDLCGIHYPDNEENRQFAVVYNLNNL